MLKIALLGSGQIGSRHLQGLARLDRPAEIYVFDPSANSLQLARERFEQVQATIDCQIKAVNYFTNLEQLPKNLDFAVIATAANHRRQVMEALLQHANVPNLLLEKIVFQNEGDFSDIDRLLKEKKVRAWVNCPVRRWPGYHKLLSRDLGTFNLSVVGSNWGLACNGIHYLDLFQRMTGQSITLDASGLDQGSIPSKREGFVELTGYLTGYSGAHRITLGSLRDGHSPSMVTLTSQAIQCIIREDLGRMWVADADSSWKLQEQEFGILYQSQITNTIIQDIIDNGQTDLPSYETSWQTHTPFLNVIHKHLGACPVT